MAISASLRHRRGVGELSVSNEFTRNENKFTTTKSRIESHILPASVFLAILLTSSVYYYSLSSHSTTTTASYQQQQHTIRNNTCPFRTYPPHRYYLLDQPRTAAPDFLTTSNYIYGEWPVLLTTTSSSSLSTSSKIPTLPILSTPPRKLCVDQSAWRNSTVPTLPFADGTNPSLLSLARLRQHTSDSDTTVQNVLQQFPDAAFLATVCMTNSQCAWRDTVEQQHEYHLGTPTTPDVVVTVLQLLSRDGTRLAQCVIRLERDAPWGTGRQRRTATNDEFLTPALDDARLFVFNNNVWISYREGPRFGYDTQVLNPLHWQLDHDNNNLIATLRASETTSVCCGRNMALVTHPSEPTILRALTWVDPVTVVTVDTTPHVVQYNDSAAAHSPRRRRRRRRRDLRRSQSTKASLIHGTNAFMVYLPDTREYLGVGHFHRPPDRQPNPYARFGHHYTHAWFTMTAVAPFALTAVSPEWVLTSHDRHDAHVIQFISGLELVPDEPLSSSQHTVVLAYGVNDCEAAVTTLALDRVRSMLRPVEAGQQVVDLMRPLND